MDDCGRGFNLVELKGEVGNMSRSAFCNSFEDRNSTLEKSFILKMVKVQVGQRTR